MDEQGGFKQAQRELGVFYAPADLAGFGRRVVAAAIDLVVVVLGAAIIDGAGGALGVPATLTALLIVVLGWAYLGLLKTRANATFGYRLADVQLVDLYGARASLWRSSCRALFMFFGPLNLGLDLPGSRTTLIVSACATSCAEPTSSVAEPCRQARVL
jgi:uncharacterized RDD family membrane protein YckC